MTAKRPPKAQLCPESSPGFSGHAITSDAGLLAWTELEDTLSLTNPAAEFLKESRTGNNISYGLIPLRDNQFYRPLRQLKVSRSPLILAMDSGTRRCSG